MPNTNFVIKIFETSLEIAIVKHQNMKKIYAIVIAVLICQSVFGQDKYVYNSVGKLNYVVSDTLKHEQNLIGDVFVESAKTRSGAHAGYYTRKSFIVNDNEFKLVRTTYEPYVFGCTVSKKSLKSLIVWLRYVKNNYESQGSSTQYAFIDESLTLDISILIPTNYTSWMLVCEGKEYRFTSIIDDLITNLEKLSNTLENKQNEYRL